MSEFSPALLVQARAAVGLSQSGLARRTGLSQGHISDLERGDRRPLPATLRKLARGLGVPLAALLSSSLRTTGVRDHFDRRALVALRHLLDVSQAGLARRTGLSQGHVSELERGVKEPQPETARKLADGLGVPVTMLYSVTGSLADNVHALAIGLQVAAVRHDGQLTEPDFRRATRQLVRTLAALGLLSFNGSQVSARGVVGGMVDGAVPTDGER